MDDQLFKTTDRCIAILLLTMKLEIVKKEKERNYKTTFYFDREAAKPWLKRWQCGEKIPIEDIRDLYAAETTFNSAVHDEI